MAPLLISVALLTRWVLINDTLSDIELTRGVKVLSSVSVLSGDDYSSFFLNYVTETKHLNKVQKRRRHEGHVTCNFHW